MLGVGVVSVAGVGVLIATAPVPAPAASPPVVPSLPAALPPSPAPEPTSPPPGEAVASPSAEEAPPAAPPEPEGPVARFRSAVEGTKRLTVSCGSGSGEGTAEAVVGGEEIGDCTVTAVDQKRKRYITVVKKATAGTWTCFEGETKECVRTGD